MVAMARAGGGNHYYGETAEDLMDPFHQELELLGNLCLRDVRLSVRAVDGVEIMMLNDLPTTEGGRRLHDLAWEAQSWAMLRLKLAATSLPAVGQRMQLLRVLIAAYSLAGEDVQLERAGLALPVLTHFGSTAPAWQHSSDEAPSCWCLVQRTLEHLLTACAELADAVVQRCLNVTVIVTSREGLGVAGELTYRVPSLSLPDPKRDVTPEDLAQYEAVRLFVERAHWHSRQFALTPQNAPAVASVCRRLDGIPLAIELAAARLRSLAIDELNARLDQRFRILTGGSRTALPRQQTLRALIDWSHDLLDPTEQALLRRLSVFAGGWTLAEAEQVCSGEGVGDDTVLDLLTALADKSLVLAEARDGAIRYRLLETVRQYARDRLLEHGEGRPWRDRHLALFAALAKEALPHLRGTEQQAWMDRLEAEHDNLRAALTWSCAAEGNIVAGMGMADSLFSFWYVRGYLTEAYAWYTALLAVESEVPPELRAAVLSGAGVMAWQKGDYAASRSFNENALEIRRTLGDRLNIGSSLINLGIVDFDQGNYEAARRRFEEGLEIRRELGSPKSVAAALHNLAAVAEAVGDHDRAWQLFDETVQIYRRVGDPWGMATSTSNLAAVASHRSDHRAAHALNVESLSIRRQLGDRPGIAESLEGLANDLRALGAPARAARTWGAAEHLRDEIGFPMSPTARADYLARVVDARAAIADSSTFDRAWQEGRSMTLEHAIDDALQPVAA